MFWVENLAPEAEQLLPTVCDPKENRMGSLHFLKFGSPIKLYEIEGGHVHL